jgi:hypothetical protein
MSTVVCSDDQIDDGVAFFLDQPINLLRGEKTATHHLLDFSKGLHSLGPRNDSKSRVDRLSNEARN